MGSDENGKFKVPSLRNIAKTAPYMHNGVFADLKEVVDFYNTRDVDSKWAAPEVAENVNTDELGDLKLTEDEVDSIVAFMKTLTDAYQFVTKPTFSAQSGLIELPYVRTEGINQPDKYYSAQLQLTDTGFYELTQLDEIEITDFSMLTSMPYYSFDTGILELPVISSIDNSIQMETFIAQLKYIPANDGKLYFELIYFKNLTTK
ncbi:MAG: hypothetical protein DRQ62_00630 [Gammaproteobacteria bacterium]|nr:MAG: hypothetical protein DRQ62_00630 [Gammaproteobacteria bacterium]